MRRFITNCDCPACSAKPLVTWNHVALVSIAGSVAMIVDLAGLTPALGIFLGIIPR